LKAIIDDEANQLAMLQEETQDAITDALNQVKLGQATIEINGHCIYKSTLVS